MKPASPSPSLPLLPLLLLLLLLLSLTATAALVPPPRPEACLGYTSCQSWLRQAVQSDLAHAAESSPQSSWSPVWSGEDESVRDSASSLHVPSHHVLPLTTLAYRLADREFSNRPMTLTHDVPSDVALASEGPLESSYPVAIAKLSTPASDVLVVVDSDALPAKLTWALEAPRELEELEQDEYELEQEMDEADDVEEEEDIEGPEDDAAGLEAEDEDEEDEEDVKDVNDVTEVYDDDREELEDDVDILYEVDVEEDVMKLDESRYWLTEATIHMERYAYVPMDDLAASERGGDEKAANHFRSQGHLAREPSEGIVVGLVILFLAGIIVVEMLDYFWGAESQQCRCSGSDSRTSSIWRRNRLGRIRLGDEECVKSWSQPALMRGASATAEEFTEKSSPCICVVDIESDVDSDVEEESRSEQPRYHD